MKRHLCGHFFSNEKLLFGIALAMLLGFAFFLRFWNIEHLPAGLYPDEAMNGVDALRANETGQYQFFYPNNNGREGLFINLQAFSLLLFGTSVAALKLWSAIFGTLTVLGAYLLAKELWQKRGVALFSAFLVASSYWAINFSRIGFRAIMVPCILLFSFYFVFRGLRTKNLLSFFVGGLIFGLGFHTYIAFRIAPAILVILAIGGYFSYKNFFALFWRHAVAFAIGAAITLAPMIATFAMHPEYLSSRSASISIFSPEVNHGHLFLTFAKTFGLSLEKYTFVGDMNWRHNYPPYPLLDFVSGALFLSGFVLLISRVFLLMKRRWKDRERNRELMISLFLLGWFFVMLAPEFLTEEGVPHALRSIGTLPAVFLIAAFPSLFFGEWLKKQLPGMRLWALLVVSAVLSLIAVWNVGKYFVFFAHNQHARDAFNENFTAMSRFAETLPQDTRVYVLANGGGTMIDNGLPITAQPLVFFLHDEIPGRVQFLEPKTVIETPAVLIPQNWDDSTAKKALSAFPGSHIETIPYGENAAGIFRIIRIPKP